MKNVIIISISIINLIYLPCQAQQNQAQQNANNAIIFGKGIRDAIDNGYANARLNSKIKKSRKIIDDIEKNGGDPCNCYRSQDGQYNIDMNTGEIDYGSFDGYDSKGNPLGSGVLLCERKCRDKQVKEETAIQSESKNMTASDCFLKGYQYSKNNDYTNAFLWYLQAANKGDAGSQAQVGGMYELGEGIEKDYSKALYWLQQAANQGYDYAQWRLGIIYEFGSCGVNKNINTAVAYYKAAAVQGYQKAQSALQRLGM